MQSGPSHGWHHAGIERDFASIAGPRLLFEFQGGCVKKSDADLIYDCFFWLVFMESLRRELDLAIKIRKNQGRARFLHFKCVKSEATARFWIKNV